MSNLSNFLNPSKPENVKFVASKRFTNQETGEPVEWETKCISPKAYKQIKKDCTKKVPIPGKKGLYLPETDIDAVLCKLAVACIVEPNLNDAELQDHYGVMGADDLLQAMLCVPGEYDDCVSKIQEVNGFDITFEEKVEEAKN